MAPGGGGKRKRGDRTYSHDSGDGSRPSPHRPGNLSLAQQSYQYQAPQNHGFPRDQQDQRGRGGRRPSRGGRGGSLRSPLDSPNATSVQNRQGNLPSRAMSPPPPPTQRSADPVETSTTELLAPVTNVSTQTPASKPTKPPSIYFYEFLTSDLCSSWHLTGRATIVALGRNACHAQDAVILGAIFQETIRSGLDGRIDPSEAGGAVKDILEARLQSEGQEPSFSGASVFLNCLSVLTESDVTQASLQPMVMATGILPLLIREELESTLLEHLGLIRNTFVRIGIRRQTNLLYRQSNYNLLREETEGYSKLITELFTTSSNEPPSAEVVEDTFERVKAMIGTFDLDVGRVLDVTLDVFAAVLVKQYRFFVKYLRVSSWWPQSHLLAKSDMPSSVSNGLPKWALPDNSGLSAPSEEEKAEITEARTKRDQIFWERVREIGMKAYFEIGGRKVEDGLPPVASSGKEGEEITQADEDRQWIETTGTLPPPGNKTAAQILGFKLRFYSSPARDPNDTLPVNLIYLAALLIKIGFISLRDLYPHLWPADEDMEKVREEKLKEKLEREKLNRPGGAMNALTTAGALADDTIPSSGRLRETDVTRGSAPKVDPVVDRTTPAPKAEAAEELPEPADQKVQLLRSLLCIGAIPESLFILGRYHWLPDAFPDLPDYIHRILHYSISKVYEPLRPLYDRTELREQHKAVDLDQSGVPKGQLRQIDQPPRKVLRWAQLDKDDTNEGTDYRFYWDDWTDNVPICQSVDDVFSLCSTLLNYSGVKIGQDPALLVKLARIGNHSLATDLSERNKSRWIDLSKRLLVPALSLTKSNAGVVTEVFELIKQFSTTIRYSIYAEWYSGAISRLPDIKLAFDQVRAETKDVLKRISKTNVKPMARALAKVATASPGVVFSVAIAQIESYDNLVEVVVECARYFTYLGYDVLTWSLMSSLGTRGRNRVQADGMLTSKWLAALSLFAGKVFKRYSVMSPTPILQYVTEELRKGNSTDLIVLEEITSSMAGIVSDTNFNESQVNAMAGGDLLQSQTMLQLLDRRHESTSTAKRLMKSLVDPKLAGQLLISIAQERQTCVFKLPEEDAHLKLLGNLFDEIHRVLTQYLDLLRSRLAIKDFNALVPGVTELIGDFGIDPSVAFWISRPSIAAEMKQHDIQTPAPERAVEKKDSSQQQPDKPDVEMAHTGSGELDTKVVAPSGEESELEKTEDGVEPEVVMKAAPQTEQPAQSPSAKVNGSSQPWHPMLQTLMKEIRPKISAQTWKILSEAFYITFWQLSLGDMHVPTQSYEDEINRQKKKIVAINSDRSDISVAGTQKKDKEKKMINELQDQLRAELKEQVTAYQQTRSRLQKEKEHWFAECWGKWDMLNVALLEHCFIPRILISPIDAIYTFKMLKLLHSSGAKNFRTMGLLDQLFNGKRLISVFFLCTAKEAENVGRFLNEVLKDLSRWHTDKALFEREAYGPKKDLPGFCKKMADDKTIISFWDYEDFRRVLQKWHMNLHTALKACFTGGEYMHIRNAIVILKAVYLHFPVINWMGQAQVASITELTKTESREDLKIAATSLLGNLRRREKDWVLPQAFNLNKTSANGINGGRSASAKPTTPQPEAPGNQTLNAQAPDFKPTMQTAMNASSKLLLTTSGRLEVEDGEINDMTMANTVARATNSAKILESTTSADTTSEQQTSKQLSSENSTLASGATTDVSYQPAVLEAEVSKDDTTASQPIQSKEMSLNSNGTVNEGQSSILVRPLRPETNRNLSENTLLNRQAHGLPSRPDALPVPSRAGEQRYPDRQNDRAPREQRDSRYADHGRMDRPNDLMRDRIGERHMSALYQRGYDRQSERGQYEDRDRLEPSWGGDKSLPGRPPPTDRHTGPPSRDLRPSTRDERLDRNPRDRPFPESIDGIRNGDQHGRSSRDHSMAPPRLATSQHPDRAPPIHGPPDLDRDRPSIHSDRRNDNSRYESHPASQRGSRTSSPSRRDDHRPTRHEHHVRDDRLGSDTRKAPEEVSIHPPRYDDSRPPTGPRTDRHSDGPLNVQNERLRDASRVAATNAQYADTHHFRSNQISNNSIRQQDPQYGRLNAEVPSGPRLSNGAHGPQTRSSAHIASAPHAPTNTLASPTAQSSITAPMILDIQAPTGPSSNRPPPRGSAPFTRLPPTSTSTPSTPVTESPDVASVHPDRLKAIQGSNADVSSSSTHTSNQTAPLALSTAPPAGPRGPHSGQPQSPMASSRQAQGPPTGPSIPNSDRSRSDKRFADIKNMLQQSSGPNGSDRSSQGASIRGRGGRANNHPINNVSSPITSGPPTPSMARQDHHPSRQESFPPTRADLFANRSSGDPNSPHHGNEDLTHNRNAWRDGAERRSARHRDSRSHSRDRHPTSSLPPLSLPPTVRDLDRLPRRGEDLSRDHRGRGGPGIPPLNAEVGGREGRRGGRDVELGPKDRERRAEGDRRDLDEWAVGRGGGGGDRGDERERRDGGRKRGRAGDEGSMGFPGDGKRHRRGM